jgi:hypothetical protein
VKFSQVSQPSGLSNVVAAQARYLVGVDPSDVASALALFLGVLLVVAGLRGRKRGYARRLEGFALLSSAVAVIGLAAITFGTYGILKG